MTKKLALIYPSQHSDLYQSSLLFSPLALAYVGAYTPKDWVFSLYDEYVGNIVDPSEIDADLVAMSSLTPNIPRSFYLANKLRERGIKVILGGAHVSALPEEALHHVDTVVKGEAESVWPQVISDFENGNLQKIYDGRMDQDLKDIRLPRRDLIHPNYKFPSVITSRGCPYNCDYCYLSVYKKNKYRVLPVDTIIEDMDRMAKTTDSGSMISFADENVSGYSEKDYENRIELFEKMIKKNYGFVWGAQSTIDIYKKPELLKLMQKAGCRTLFLGLESTNNQSLGNVVNKEFAVGIDYKNAIKTIHKNKISVIGSFIIGLDNQDKNYAKNLASQMKKMNIEIPRIFYLTAWPGTKLYDELKEKQRLKKGWNKVRKDLPSIEYKHFKTEEIVEARKSIYDNFYTKSYIFKIVLRWIFKEPKLVRFFLKMIKWNRVKKWELRKLQQKQEDSLRKHLEDHFKDTEYAYILSEY